MRPADAAQAFVYARGATFHLETALAQFRAVASGGADNALGDIARTHVAAAATDLASASHFLRSNAPGDARLGAGLVDTLGDRLANTSESLGALATTPAGGNIPARPLRAALRQAHAGTLALAPHAGSDAWMLPLAPAAALAASDTHLVRTAAAARMFRETSPVQRRSAERLLRTGTIDPEPRWWVGGYGNGNGAMPVMWVHHPQNRSIGLLAVQRPATAQAAQEDFVYQMARHLKVDHLLAPVSRRQDGSAMVQVVDGHALWDENIRSVQDVDEVLATWYRTHTPGMDEAQVARAARVDRQLLQALDYIVAQSDRHDGNALASRAAGSFNFIDNGFAGQGERHDALRPALKEMFQGPGGRNEVDPEVLELIRSRLSDSRLRAAHAVLRAPAPELPDGHAKGLAQLADGRFLEAMRARRDHLLRTGGYDYVPLPREADPIRAVDDMNGGRHPFA